jgi:hypothetical protein
MYETELNHEENYENPNWENIAKTHDWRNYVGERTRFIWNEFSLRQKHAIALDAQDLADAEDWD